MEIKRLLSSWFYPTSSQLLQAYECIKNCTHSSFRACSSSALWLRSPRDGTPARGWICSCTRWRCFAAQVPGGVSNLFRPNMRGSESSRWLGCEVCAPTTASLWKAGCPRVMDWGRWSGLLFSIITNLDVTYVPIGVCPLELCFAILAWGGQFGLVDEGILSQIESGGSKPRPIHIQLLGHEWGFRNHGVALAVQAIRSETRDVPTVAWDHCVLGLVHVLHRISITGPCFSL